MHYSFYLVVTLVQKPQQWQTQNVIKSMRRQKKWFICVKRQWPWLKVGHSDRCHIFALDIEIIEYNGNYFVFNDCLMWLVVLITIAYDLWNMHNYAVVLFSVFGLWLAPSTRTHAIEKKQQSKRILKIHFRHYMQITVTIFFIVYGCKCLSRFCGKNNKNWNIYKC